MANIRNKQFLRTLKEKNFITLVYQYLENYNYFTSIVLTPIFFKELEIFCCCIKLNQLPFQEIKLILLNTLDSVFWNSDIVKCVGYLPADNNLIISM